MLLHLLSARDHEPRLPARGAAATWWRNRFRTQAAARDQPCGHRVGVPHLTRSQLVSTPNGRGEGGNHVKQSLCTLWIIGQPPRAIDRFTDVRDDAIAP